MCVKQILIKNFGPIQNLDFNCSSGINLIIGSNSTGKTWLLKSVYTVLKSIEESGRGNNPKTLDEIFSERLYWTYQNPRLGDLVAKGSLEKASVDIIFSDGKFRMGFSSSAEKKSTDNKYNKKAICKFSFYSCKGSFIFISSCKKKP